MTEALQLANLRARTIRYVENEIYEDASELDALLRAQSVLLQKDKMLFAPAGPSDNSRFVSLPLKLSQYCDYFIQIKFPSNSCPPFDA